MKNTKPLLRLEATVPPSLAGIRLDQALAKIFPEYSRSQWQAWLKEGKVKIEPPFSKGKEKVLGNEHILLETTLDPRESWEPQETNLSIIDEDESLLIINKPVGLVVHPAAGNPDHTLVNALLHHCSHLNSLPRAGLIHRLDKDTSGLLVVAKTLPAHTALVKALQKREIEREYEAIVNGAMVAGGTIDAPIGRHRVARKKMAVIESGKPAITHYRVLKRFPAHTHLKIKLETGRTHQIRVHMAHLHHPIVGDPVYGRLVLPKNATPTLIAALRQFKHQALHAKRLAFIHPITGKKMEWETKIPEDMQNLLRLLEENTHAE